MKCERCGYVDKFNLCVGLLRKINNKPIIICDVCTNKMLNLLLDEEEDIEKTLKGLGVKIK